MADYDPQIAEARRIVDQVWPAISAALGGREPEVQGAVLADLVATWLAGYTGVNPQAVDGLRETLLKQHIDFVRLLIPVNEALAAAAIAAEK